MALTRLCFNSSGICLRRLRIASSSSGMTLVRIFPAVLYALFFKEQNEFIGADGRCYRTGDVRGSEVEYLTGGRVTGGGISAGAPVSSSWLMADASMRLTWPVAVVDAIVNPRAGR